MSASFSIRKVPSIVLGVDESDLLTHAIPYLKERWRLGVKKNGEVWQKEPWHLHIYVDVLHIFCICTLILVLYIQECCVSLAVTSKYIFHRSHMGGIVYQTSSVKGK